MWLMPSMRTSMTASMALLVGIFMTFLLAVLGIVTVVVFCDFITSLRTSSLAPLDFFKY